MNYNNTIKAKWSKAMNLSEVKLFKGVGLNGFQLHDEPGMVHCIPLSGGADSSALALLLHERYPEIDFVLMNTDTGAESPESYEVLDQIEKITGKKIDRVKGEHDLWGLIEKYNGFLPSSQSRWCTRELKLVVFKKWMEKYKGRKMAMYIGIRSDEASRLAFSIDGVDTVMPFIDAGWKRADVFNYLSRTVGIPKSYMTRSRSGCSVCPFVRRQEVVGLLERQPGEFEKGMRYEKLNEEDKNRHAPGMPLWMDSGIAGNWLSFPMPGENEVITGKKVKSNDLFGNSGMFAAVEYFEDAMPGMPSFVWHQRLISYSPSLNGIKRQVNDRYQHLLATAEVYEMTPEDIRNKAKFAVWYVEHPAEVMDVDGPGKGSYTWQNGQSYAQVRHITDWLKRALHAEQMRREANMKVKSELSFEYEFREASKDGIAAAEKSGISVGNVIGGMWQKPKEVAEELTEEEELSLLPCPMCHI
jgi:3'-phosphoadenosine 5'-phosphosulfate sulfotransferase (PAPS reductase)/FAD synthetase